MEAPRSKYDLRDDGPAAAAAGGGGGGGGLQLLELGDPRLRAAGFFLSWGCCILIYGTVLNRSANPEHLLAGYALFIVGAMLALLTLGGGGRAAARLEAFLRAFF